MTLIKDLPLSIRAKTCCANLGITTLEQLNGRSVVSLLRTKYMGRKSIAELRAVMATYGMAFAD